MVLTLYKYDLSPPVRSVRMVIEHLKLPVRYVEVNFMKGEHLTEEYKKINPEQKVPSLSDDDFILTDSHAISTYLINKYAKDDSLYPTEPKLRAIVDQRLHFDSGILFPAAKNAFRQVVVEGGKRLTDNTIYQILSAYEITNKFTTNTWLAGEQFTVADICCVTTISSLNEMFPIDADKYPKLNAWLKRCSAKDIYKKMNVPGNTQLGETFRRKLA